MLAEGGRLIDGNEFAVKLPSESSSNVWDVIPVGTDFQWEAEETVFFFLKINERSSDLKDNEGEVVVQISPAKKQ